MSTITKSKLSITTPSELEIVLTREFDAPRELVWQAYTTPEHIKRWWGCNQSTLTTCEVDLRKGGAWRNVLSIGEDQEWGFHGVYREIQQPERLVFTQIFEPMPQHPSLVTVTFNEQNSKTLLHEVILHESVEARDGHLQSGMEEGVAQTFDKLEAHLITLA